MPTNMAVIVILIWLIMTSAVSAEEPTLQTHPEQFIDTHTRVDWHQIVTPFQKILLIKQKERFGAVRFTAFHREDDAKQPSVTSEGRASEYAEYDWFYQGDGSGNFKKANAKQGHGKLVSNPLRGIGRFAFQTGTVYLECGKFKLFWLYPTSVSFPSEAGCTDTSLELAPTKWNRIEDVSVHDAKIKWYRCDESRKSFLIPVEDL
jgi:hypothetical protein